MLYSYQYNVASILLTAILLFIYLIRNKYFNKSSIIFIIILFTNLVSSTFDLISCFTISYPDKYNKILNCFVSIGYLYLFNCLNILEFAYIGSIGKIKKFYKLENIIIISSFIFYTFIILTSQFTHLIVYFDNNMIYHHGILVPLLYIWSFIFFVLDGCIFIKAKNKFNKYQVIASISFVIGMGVSVSIQIFYPSILINNFILSIILFFIYITFENPSYYTYKDTQCLNRKAFINVMKRRINRRKKDNLLVITLSDNEYAHTNLGFQKIDKLTTKLADILFNLFKNNVYCFENNKYVIVCKNNTNKIYSLKLINLFKNPIVTNETTYNFNYKLNTIYDISNFSVDDLELLIKYANIDINYNNSLDILNSIKLEINKKETILRAIEKAIINQSFEVYYQPIYNIKTKKYESAEALIRLFDDELGFVNPEELIIIAEQNGYINQIDEIVFNKVCKFISQNNLEKFGVQYIEINLSPIQCLKSDLVDNYFKIMKKYNISPNQINLEITETAKFTNEEQIIKNLKLFDKKGISLSIDDYGSGFASINYLTKLPISYVKIDKEILWTSLKDNKAMIILKNTIKMLKELGKKIIIEGVETQDLVNFLEDADCDYNQGYYFSKPINDENYLRFLKEKNNI